MTEEFLTYEQMVEMVKDCRRVRGWRDLVFTDFVSADDLLDGGLVDGGPANDGGITVNYGRDTRAKNSSTTNQFTISTRTDNATEARPAPTFDTLESIVVPELVDVFFLALGMAMRCEWIVWGVDDYEGRQALRDMLSKGYLASRQAMDACLKPEYRAHYDNTLGRPSLALQEVRHDISLALRSVCMHHNDALISSLTEHPRFTPLPERAR